MAQQVKQKTQCQYLGQEDPMEEGVATHQYSCLGNSMDRGAWRATVLRVAKRQTGLSYEHTQRQKVKEYVSRGNGDLGA